MEALLSKCVNWDEVGSRVTCDPPVVDTDRDFLCLVENVNAFIKAAEKEGFELAGSKIDEATETCDGRSDFCSLSDGEINLIATDSKEFYDKFMVATRLATRLNLLNKDDRIALFQAVLYANG